MADKTFEASLRPLLIPALEHEFPGFALEQESPGDEKEVAVQFLRSCVEAPEKEPVVEVMRERCAECSAQCTQPVIVPNHPFVMQHIVRPLLDAKRCYVLKMPVACIAQAGFVGEMLAVWRHQMVAFRIGSTPVDERQQSLLYGRDFMRLSQNRRIQVLDALGNLDSELRSSFNTLRRVRNKYLHYMIDPTEQDVDADAREAMRCACDLLNRTLRMEIRKGAVSFAPTVMRFIKDIIRPADEAQTETPPE